MAAPPSLQPPKGRRGRHPRNDGRPDDDRQTQFKRLIWTSLGNIGVALIVVWLLQPVVGPLCPGPPRFPTASSRRSSRPGRSWTSRWVRRSKA